MKKVIGYTLLISFGVALALIIGEVALRIYNPLPSRVMGEDIILLSNYKRTIYFDQKYQQNGLEELINYSTNSLGFRGNEPPDQFDDQYSIFAVGGSTTECALLDDSKTWPYQLQNSLSQEINDVWINNAGIDGTSLYTHRLLLSEHIYKHQPSMVLLLVGINDMFIAELTGEQNLLQEGREHLFRSLSQKSELFSFIWNLYRQISSKKMKAGHAAKRNLENLTEEQFKNKSDLHIEYQQHYVEQLDAIVKECLHKKINVVLITQPVYQLRKYHPFTFIELYNESTRQVGMENGVPVIDLAHKLGNNPAYYYDAMHYTNDGAKQVAKIIHEDLVKIILSNI